MDTLIYKHAVYTHIYSLATNIGANQQPDIHAVSSTTRLQGLTAAQISWLTSRSNISANIMADVHLSEIKYGDIVTYRQTAIE